MRLFRNRRFSAASLAVTLGFFSLFGFIFLVTQYFQLVKGYSALQAGVRTVPFAVAMAIGAITAPRIVKRAGTKLVVAAGLTLMAAGFAVAATTDAASSYGIIVVAMVFMGSGLGVALTPATESILGALPRDQAGVGSAVNDTTREVGGTLGVAVLGSIMATLYGRPRWWTRCAAPGCRRRSDRPPATRSPPHCRSHRGSAARRAPGSSGRRRTRSSTRSRSDRW